MTNTNRNNKLYNEQQVNKNKFERGERRMFEILKAIMIAEGGSETDGRE